MDGRAATARDARLRRALLAPALVSAALGALLLAEAIVSPHGVKLELTTPDGATLRSVRATPLARHEVDRRTLGSEEVSARFSGYWRPDAAGPAKLNLFARGAVHVALDDRTLIHDGSRAVRRLKGSVDLEQRPYRIEVTWQRVGADAPFRLRWVPPGEGLLLLEPGTLFTEEPGDAALGARQLARWLRRVLLPLSAAGLLGLAILVGAGHLGRPWGWAPLSIARFLSPGVRAWAPRAALGLILFYAALLRGEALIGSFWDVSELWPWADSLHPRLVELRPETFRWPPHVPHRSGDPYAYLRYGRAMENFYGASVREPLFVFATKLGLWLADDNDVGVGIASAFFSTLTVAATYLLGARAFGPLVGLLAALGFAVEPRVIGLSIQGWRDDAFACTLVLFAWAAVRFFERGSRREAALLGLTGGAAWLTRITSITFLAPTLLALAVLPWRGFDATRIRRLATAGLGALALMGPFLVSCWLTYGDPLYPANEGVHFYRTRAGLSYDSSMTVVDHLTTSFRPMQMLDTLFIGYTAHPFAPKWNFDDWWSPLSGLLPLAAIVGMAAWLAVPRGRLLLIVHAAAMLPFSLAWDVLAGSPWRHSLHAYPFYLLAAAWTLQRAGAALLTQRGRARAGRWLTPPPLLRWSAAAFVLLGTGWLLSHGLYYGRKAEAVAVGKGRILLEAGPRDALVFGRGWLPPTKRTNWHVRFMRSSRAELHVPLAGGHRYRLSLRLDPAGPTNRQRPLEVWINGERLSSLPLSYDPERMGEYAIEVAAGLVRDGRNDLELRTPHLVPVPKALSPPAGLPRHWEVALELRYVGIERLPRQDPR